MKTITKINHAVALVMIAATLIFTVSCKKENLNEPNSSNKSTNLSVAKADPAIAAFRPFSDYLNAQGQTSIYVPPVPDFTGWSDPRGARSNYYSLFRCVSFDYNGTSAAYLASHGGPVINTTVTGSVREIPLQDGRAKVTVKVHTENALTFAFTTTELFTDPFIFLHAPLDFGYRANDLLTDPSLTPALGSSDFSITFYNPAPGAPIPDMLVFSGSRFSDVITESFQSTSSGTFHALSGFTEGSQGIVMNNQKAAILVGFKDNHPVFVPVGTTNDAFPVETVTYKLR